MKFYSRIVFSLATNGVPYILSKALEMGIKNMVLPVLSVGSGENVTCCGLTIHSFLVTLLLLFINILYI